MTVIAWDGEVLAADKLMCAGVREISSRSRRAGQSVQHRLWERRRHAAADYLIDSDCANRCVLSSLWRVVPSQKANALVKPPLS